MFANLATYIRGLPWWAQALAWPVYGLGQLVAAVVSMLGHIVRGAVGGSASVVLKGSVMAILIKITAVLLPGMLIAGGLGLDFLAALLFMGMVITIMLMGMRVMVNHFWPLSKPKKKKKKK